MRRLALLVTFVALTTSAAGSAAARAATGEPACPTAEVRQHDEAVFGHFANRADALKLKARARAKGSREVSTAGFRITFRPGAQ